VVLERRIIVAQGRRKLEKELPGILADATSRMRPRIRQLISDLRGEWQMLDDRIASVDAELVSQAYTDETAGRLSSVPGIGAINATALVAGVSDGCAFARGRDMAAWLGLVPRQASPRAQER